ncbi:MAG: hypothetical protein R2791_12190 [Saprospiraceae bacterium]
MFEVHKGLFPVLLRALVFLKGKNARFGIEQENNDIGRVEQGIDGILHPLAVGA